MAKKRAAGKSKGTGAGIGRPEAYPTEAARSYKHPESELLLRPDVGTQAQFRKRKPPARYRYDPRPAPGSRRDPVYI